MNIAKESTYEQKQEAQRQAYEYAREIRVVPGTQQETMAVAAYMAGYVNAIELKPQ